MTINRVKEFLDDCIIVDTETTSKDYKEAEVIEFGSVNRVEDKWDILFSELFKPKNTNVVPEISAITHITDKMVKDKPYFEDGCEAVTSVLTLAQQHDFVLVAHNAPYDKGVLANYQTLPDCSDSWVCTMRLAKRLYIDDDSVKQYNLQYLRYRFDLDIPENIDPHRASSDCIVTAKLLEYLVTELANRNILDESRPYKDQMRDWISVPLFVPKMMFGKHRDQKWEDIPTDYIVWAINNLDCLREDNPLYDGDMVHTITQVMTERL